jgi:predicted TIM-barrel fold metal-dependent hydrolase
LKFNRRAFLATSLAGAAAVSLAQTSKTSPPGIVDTNINLFDWPFRALKYRDPAALVAKLKKHRVIQGWAGSFEALFAKDINGVNERLARACREHGRRFLIPFGAVNLAWPDWQEDIRRCQEVFKMAGLRIYPGYQPFDLAHPAMPDLLQIVSKRGMILQIVFGMEDPRVHHPIIDVKPLNLRALLKAMDAAPEAKVQLLHYAAPAFPPANQADFAQFISKPNTFLEISRLEGNGAIGRLLGAIDGLPSLRAPLDRITFGSHAPYFPVETALLKLIESPLDPTQLRAITRGNARRLLPD